MTARFRRVAVFVGAAALATGAGIGVATQGDSSSAADRSTNAPGMTSPQGPGGGGAAGGFDVSALADELGVTETRLEQAMRNTRPTDPSAGGGPDDMIQALADELGLSVDKVHAAFESALPQGAGGAPPSGTAPPSGSRTTPPGDGQSTAPSDGTTSPS